MNAASTASERISYNPSPKPRNATQPTRRPPSRATRKLPRCDRMSSLLRANTNCFFTFGAINASMPSISSSVAAVISGILTDSNMYKSSLWTMKNAKSFFNASKSSESIVAVLPQLFRR